MNTLKTFDNIRSSNTFERLIYENNLRIIDLKIYKKQDLIIVLLNNGTLLQVNLSTYPYLKKAPDNALKNWVKVDGGIGIEWQTLSFDINLKSFLEEDAIYTAIQKLKNSSTKTKSTNLVFR